MPFMMPVNAPAASRMRAIMSAACRVRVDARALQVGPRIVDHQRERGAEHEHHGRIDARRRPSLP